MASVIGLTFLPPHFLVCMVFTLQQLPLLPPWGPLFRAVPSWGAGWSRYPTMNLLFHIMTQQDVNNEDDLSVGAGKLPRVVGALTSLALTLCVVSSFVSEGADPSTMS